MTHTVSKFARRGARATAEPAPVRPDHPDANPPAYVTIAWEWEIWREHPDRIWRWERTTTEENGISDMDRLEAENPGTVYELRRSKVTRESWPLEVTNLGSQYAARQEAEKTVEQ